METETPTIEVMSLRFPSTVHYNLVRGSIQSQCTEHWVTVASKQSLSPAPMFVLNICSFLIIRQKIKRSKCSFFPVISFKIGYVKYWLSPNFAQRISKMATEYTLENWGLKNLIESRKLIFVNPMAVKKFADMKSTPC